MPFDFPGAPNPGDVFTDPSSGASFTWNGYAWMGGAANSLGALVVSDTPPSAPANNSLWFESDTGMLFIRYNDGNSSQWVQLNALPNGAGYMPLRGVTDGSDAPAGQIGEVISSAVTTNVPLTSTVAAAITTIALTPGDWDVSGNALLSATASTVTGLYAAISVGALSIAAPTNPSGARTTLLMTTGISPSPAGHNLPLRTCRISLSALTTIYLGAQINNSAGTATGDIWARRAH